MGVLAFRDGNGDLKYREVTGTGTEGDPFVFVEPGVVASGAVSTATDVVYALGGVRNAVLEQTVEDDGEYTQAKYDAYGAQWVIHNGIVAVLWSGTPPVTAAQRTDVLYNGTTALTPTHAAPWDVAADSANTVLVAAVTGKKIRVISHTFTTGSTNGTVIFGSGSDAQVVFECDYGEYGGESPGLNQFGHFETDAGEALTLTTVGSSCKGRLQYVAV